MAELHDMIRRAMEAQGKVDPDAALALADEVDLEAPTKWEEVHTPDHQVPMALDSPTPITWEAFFTKDEVAATKRVRRGQQQLGPLARRWIADRVGGTIGDGDRSAKQFVNTRFGQYRISLSVDGDNTTETAAHERMGVRTIRLEAVDEAVEFFQEHGLEGARTYEELRLYLRMALRQDG
jgi:hypothetical protein